MTSRKLPVISGKKAVKAFEKAGWKFVRIGSSRHMIMKKEGVVATLSIPDHKVLDRGLLRSLIRDAYISIEESFRVLSLQTYNMSFFSKVPMHTIETNIVIYRYCLLSFAFCHLSLRLCRAVFLCDQYS